MTQQLRTALARLAAQPNEEQERIASIIIHEMGRPEHQEESPATRLDGTIGLFFLGLDMVEQKLRRTFPQASDEDIEARLQAWLRTDDMADQLPPGVRLAPERLKKLAGERG